jgi:hypothetical protein
MCEISPLSREDALNDGFDYLCLLGLDTGGFCPEIIKSFNLSVLQETSSVSC